MESLTKRVCDKTRLRVDEISEVDIKDAHWTQQVTKTIQQSKPISVS